MAKQFTPVARLLLALFTLIFLAIQPASASERVTVERLTWAGVKVTGEDTTILIDAVGRDLWSGNAPQGLVPVNATTRRRYALVTHLHNDHFDEATLKEVLGPGGYVIVHEDQAVHVASRGLRVIPARLYQPISRSGYTMTAVPAEDGFGDEQVNWVVQAGSKRIFHGGDTLWHGKWSNIGRQYGPFDVAFLPINGVRVGGEAQLQSAAVLTPEQALDAAVLLRASAVVPIHYGLNDPPHYVEVKDALESLVAQAAARGISVVPLKPGELLP